MLYDKDGDLDLLKGNTVAVIGFGSQGHAHSQNLRDSGIDVVVAEASGTAAWDRAAEAGFKVLAADAAAATASVIMMVVPDQAQKAVYESSICESLEDGDRCFFGNKAVNLGILARSGVSIPRGVAISGECLKAIIRENVCDLWMKDVLAYSDEIADSIQKVRLNKSVTDEITAFCSCCFEDGNAVAVRSSYTNEDAEDSSLAGVFSSFTNIGEIDAVISAIKAFLSRLGMRI